MRRLLILIPVISALGIVALGLVGCSVYKIDIQQGNTMEVAQIEKLKVGMSKKQVNFLMGTALLKDPFHANRWDYIYTMKPGGKPAKDQKHIVLFFEGDTLERIDNNSLN